MSGFSSRHTLEANRDWFDDVGPVDEASRVFSLDHCSPTSAKWSLRLRKVPSPSDGNYIGRSVGFNNPLVMR
eukprot:10394531-Prorocentrum_lima.AAC.1